MEWKLYYGDRTTFSSEDGEWADAPPRNVQGLATPDHIVGREMDTPLFGRSFYLWWPGAERPWSVDWAGLLDYLLEVGALAPEVPLVEVPFAVLVEHGVKFGRSLGNEGFREVLAWMQDDAALTWPRKSAYVQGEIPREFPPPPLPED